MSDAKSESDRAASELVITEAMAEAGAKALRSWDFAHEDSLDGAERVFRAMMLAAPIRQRR
jgi:hypothetical protein